MHLIRKANVSGNPAFPSEALLQIEMQKHTLVVRLHSLKNFEVHKFEVLWNAWSTDWSTWRYYLEYCPGGDLDTFMEKYEQK